MIIHENCLLACNIIPYFCRKLGKMAQSLSSAAVVIGAISVKTDGYKKIFKNYTQNVVI